MIDPRFQWAVQIEATNVCPRHCSNCTRSLAHARTPFWITPEQFQQAAEALQDFPAQSPPAADGRRKVVGMIGGEPLVHPRFAELCALFQKAIPDRSRRALWTGLPWTKSPYADVIRETFGYMNLNLHKPPSKHQPVLVAIQDVIPDRKTMWQWIDKCWVQQVWSSTINHRGFYFCEVAAALADVMDGPDGLPVTPGCWQRPLGDFREQIEWACPKCGCAIPLPGRIDNAHQDDATASNIERLTELKGPGLSRLVPFNPAGYRPQKHRAGWTPQSYGSPGTPTIWRKVVQHDPLRNVRALTVCVGYDDILVQTLPQMLKTFKEVLVVTSPKDSATAGLANSLGATVYPTEAFYRDGAAFNKGLAIEEGFDLMERSGWMAVLDADILLPDRFPDFTLEPVNLYSARRRICEDLSDWKPGDKWHKFPEWREVEYSGYLHVFHADDPTLKERPWYGTTWRHAGGCDSEFQTRWDGEHRKALPWEVLHLGPIDTNWCGRVSPRRDHRPVKLRDKSAIRTVIQTYRSHKFALHRLIDPEARLLAHLQTLELDQRLRARTLRRLARCHKCRMYRGDWCWETPGSGHSMQNFVTRLLQGNCHRDGEEE